MVYEEATPDCCAGMNLNTREPARDVGDDPCQPRKAPAGQSVTQSMRHDGMKTRIGRNDFEAGTGRRIAIEHTVQIFPQSLPQSATLVDE